MLLFAAVTALVITAVLFDTSVWNGGGVEPFPRAQAEATEEATVRVSAKRLENGRTEYGLQVQSGGVWREDRLQPSSRLLPTNLIEGRLSYSREIELGSGHVVVISASLQESGQIEFGLHEVVASGRGERQLPDQRLFPRTPPVGQWLNSSRLVLPGPVDTERFSPLVGARGWASATVQFVSRGHERGVDTVVANRSEPIPGSVIMGLHQVCLNGQDVSLELVMPASVEVTTVMTEQDLNLVEVELSIDYVDSETHYWRLERGGEHQSLSAGDSTAELLARLREASSVTVSAVGSVVRPPMFDLEGMFDTLVQANIDNCGDYVDPAWQPVTEAQSSNTEADAFYSISYPDHLDGGRRSEVRVGPSEEAGGSDANSVFFRIGCDRQHWLQLGDLPKVEQGEYVVRSRLDSGEWTEATWEIRVTDTGWVYTVPDFDYGWLRSGERLDIDIDFDRVFRASFNLTALFSTPVQTNIDNCGVSVWPSTYVPLVDISGRRGNLSYNTYQWRDEVHTAISKTVSVDAAPQGILEFTYRCYGDRQVTFGSFEHTDAEFRDVTLQIDGVELPAEPWRQETWSFSDGTEAAAVYAPDVHGLMGQLRGASSLTVTIDGSGLPPVTFDLAGMFDTPVQDNIDMCGSYKPGETRNR